jgi:cytochrome c553
MANADTELSESDIAELAEFFDLLAKYDYEDKQKKI